MGEFAGAGQVEGLELWRIEKMVPVKIDVVDGKLYSGDSYILLSTRKAKHSNSLNWDIHFWLGNETSQDEAGVAAYKTVELDESLGGAPVQHREVQEHESELFMSYFKKTGLEYLPGGIDSGFNKVERGVYRTRLLQCKGKRAVRCTEKPLAAASLNKGDVFILDMGLKLFIYNGEDSNKYEKIKGADMVSKINSERGGACEVVLVHEDPHNAEFWGTLGGEIAVTDPGQDDAAADRATAGTVRLLHVSDSAGDLTTEEVPRNEKGHYTRDMLKSEDAFILDAGSQIFVWVGKGASKAERKESMVLAGRFIEQEGRPFSTPVERVAESGETSMFKSYFHVFDPPLTLDQLRAASMGRVAAAAEDKPINAAALHNRQAAEEPVDDGSGTLQIWRVEDFKKADVPPEKYGQFYAGDSYVMLYTYKDNRGREAYIIYFWQGLYSTQDEIGASALLAKELDDEMGGAPVQVRVVQGKEPAHFRQLFKGGMIIHAGGKASGFKNRDDKDTFDDDGVSLFHVRGSSTLNVYGTQVAEVAASLNSMDCFVLVTPTHVYSWHGVGARPEEVESADKIASILKDHSYGPQGTASPQREVLAIGEGDEPEEFWAAIGGKGEYAKHPEDEPMPADPRLFQCSTAFGSFVVEEIADFTQEDMIDDDVMLLDVGTCVYLWVGSGCTSEEKQKSLQTAQEYNAKAPDGRDADIPIMKVNAGSEPAMFTQFFPGWDPELFEKNKFVDPYEAKLAKLRQKAGAEEPAAPTPPVPAGAAELLSGDFADPEATKFSYEELSSGIPAGVDPAKKEQYLSDAEFEKYLGTPRADFGRLAAWKQKAKKKDAKLF